MRGGARWARLAVAVGLLGLLLGPGRAWATDSDLALVSASPAAGEAVVEAFPRVRLEFSAPLAPDGDHRLGLFGPLGERVDGTEIEVDGTTLEVRVSSLPVRGNYTIRYTAVPAEGEALEGTYGFSYGGPLVIPVPSATPESASPGGQAGSTAPPASTPGALPTASQGAGSPGGGTTAPGAPSATATEAGGGAEDGDAEAGGAAGTDDGTPAATASVGVPETPEAEGRGGARGALAVGALLLALVGVGVVVMRERRSRSVTPPEPGAAADAPPPPVSRGLGRAPRPRKR